MREDMGKKISVKNVNIKLSKRTWKNYGKERKGQQNTGKKLDLTIQLEKGGRRDFKKKETNGGKKRKEQKYKVRRNGLNPESSAARRQVTFKSTGSMPIICDFGMAGRKNFFILKVNADREEG